MEEKRKDLVAERQKLLLQNIVQDLSRSEMDFYYRSTSDVAMLIVAYIKKGARLSQEDRILMNRLDRRDIEVMLSHH